MRAFCDRDTEFCEFLVLDDPNGDPTWEDLARCEWRRRYDPDNSGVGMTCVYVLYEVGDLEGACGRVSTDGVCIWVTAPPEVWEHPPDQPCGLEAEDDLTGI